MNRPVLFLGIDVHGPANDLYWVILVNSGTQVLDSDHGDEQKLESVIQRHQRTHLFIGVDAPRMLLAVRRKWYWKGKKWKERTTQKGFGRHCEVIIKSLKLANPQWTPPPGKEIPAWIQRGIELYKGLTRKSTTLYEVFPSASRTMYKQKPDANFRKLVGTAKKTHSLDSTIAALTIRDLEHGIGMEVGGCDGYGTIVLPRKVTIPVGLKNYGPDKTFSKRRKR